MNLSANTLQRSLSTDNNLAVTAKNYERSTAGIILEAIAGLLTGGIGILVAETYHYLNREKKGQEFTELAGTLLKGLQSMPHDESGFTTSFQEYELDISTAGNDVKIRLGSEEITIQNKTLSELRENLKKEITTHPKLYSPELLKDALNDKTPHQRSLNINFLQAQTSITKFDHISTDGIVSAASEIADGSASIGEVESRFISSEEALQKVIDEETRELIDAWEKKPPEQQTSVTHTQSIQKIEPKATESVQTPDEKRIRGFLGEIIFPSKSWHADSVPPGERLKNALIENSDILAEIYSDPELLKAAELPPDLHGVVIETLNSIKEEFKIPAYAVNKDVISEILKLVPEEKFEGISGDIDNKINSFQFSSLDSVKLLSSIPSMGEGNFQTFMKAVFTNYFDAQPVMDKRAMIASYLTNSGSTDPGEIKLVALLKAGGPYIQKLLQLFGDKAEGDLKTALDELKTGLSPINDDLIKSVLGGIIETSSGKISKIEIAGSLGAASVGQTVLANIHWKGEDKPQEVVIKLLRPGIRLRAERELKFFEMEAEKIPGMLKTFNGISSQIQVEMDLSKEARFVGLSQVYTGKQDNLQAMRLVKNIPSAQGYMVLEKAPGTTVKSAFNEMEALLEQKMDSTNPAPRNLANLASGIKALTKNWVEEALFGSGFYHGDLHAGNIMFSADAGQSGMTTVIDMGNASVLTLDQRKSVFKMVLAAAVSSPGTFVRNFENVLSEDGRELISHKRSEFLKKTTEIMQNETDPGQIIVSILNAANELGLEIPATVSNFSRSQMMLQNAINHINALIDNAVNQMDERISGLSVFIEGSPKDANALLIQARAQLEKLNKQHEDQLSASEQFIKSSLKDLVQLMESANSLDSMHLNFSRIMEEVLGANKSKSIQFASSEIFQLLTDRV